MDYFIILMLFGVLGIVIGWKLGTMWGEDADDDHQYWMRNLYAVLIGGVVCMFIMATGLDALYGLGIGLVGGTIAGLKMGYGKSVGIWQKHDRLFRVNQDQIAAAESAKRAREAGVTEREQAERDLVSVGPAKGAARDDGQDAGEKRRRGRKGR